MRNVVFCNAEGSGKMLRNPSPGLDHHQKLIDSSLPLSTHSDVEMLHDSALYKSIIDIDTDTRGWSQYLFRLYTDAPIIVNALVCHTSCHTTLLRTHTTTAEMDSWD